MDLRLRELERRWKETGSIEAEAAFLVERVRVGDLEPARLELAAALGHPAASRARPEVRPLDVRRGPLVDWTALEKTDAIAWVREVERLGGDEALMRVVAAAFSLEPVGQSADPESPHSLFCEQVQRAAYLPCEANFAAMRCHRGSDWGYTRITARWLDDWFTGTHSKALRVLVCLGLADLGPGRWSLIVARIREELGSWLLGYSDPVRARIEARARPAG